MLDECHLIHIAVSRPFLLNTYPNVMWMFWYHKQYICLIICNILPNMPFNSVFHIMLLDIIIAYEEEVFNTLFRLQFIITCYLGWFFAMLNFIIL